MASSQQAQDPKIRELGSHIASMVPDAAVLHEAVYAAPPVDLDNQDMAEDPGVQLIQKAYEQARIAAQNVSNPPVFLSYALSNIHEFSSAVISDPAMQAWLFTVST